MTDSEGDMTPKRKVEGWLQTISISTTTRQAATHLAAANNMATGQREVSRVAAAPNPTIPAPAAPSPTEVTSVQNQNNDSLLHQTMPYGYQQFIATPSPSLIGTAGPSQNSHVFQQQGAFQQHQLGYTLPPGTNPFSQGASSPQTTQPQDTAPQAPSPFQYAPTNAPQNPYRPFAPSPLGYAPRDPDPNVEVSPTVASGPMTTERLQQEAHEPAIRVSQVPAVQYTRVGKVQKNNSYARRTSTGEFRLTCERCRSKHYACNTGKPACAACSRAGVPCVYTKKRSGAPLHSRRRVATTASAPAPPPAPVLAPAPVLGPPPSPFAVVGPPPPSFAVVGPPPSPFAVVGPPPPPFAILGPPPPPFAVVGPPPAPFAIPGPAPAPASLGPLPPVLPFQPQVPEQQEAPADPMEEDDLESRIDPALRNL